MTYNVSECTADSTSILQLLGNQRRRLYRQALVLDYLDSRWSSTPMFVRGVVCIHRSAFFLVVASSPVSLHVIISAQNRAQIQAEGLLTQLVFEHSLRIRVKAEMPSISANEPPLQNPPASGAEPQPSASPSSNNLVGKINNLVTNDLETIMEAREFLHVLVTIPIQTVFSITFLYKTLDGWRCVI